MHVYIDGSSAGNPGSAGCGVLVKDEKGREILREGSYLGRMTNNMAEYEALLLALKRISAFCAERVCIYTDSALLCNQLSGRFRVKDSKLRDRYEKAKRLIERLPHLEVKYISREQNKEADRIAKEASRKDERVAAGDLPEESPGIEGQDGP